MLINEQKDSDKKKWEPPVPTRIGKKKKRSGPQTASKIPAVNPSAKCKLRLSRLDRIKDYLLLEQAFIRNQESIKPSDEKTAVRFLILLFDDFKFKSFRTKKIKWRTSEGLLLVLEL